MRVVVAARGFCGREFDPIRYYGVLPGGNDFEKAGCRRKDIRQGGLVLLPLIFIGAGGLIGAGMGYFGQCSSGTCPLTSTWWRGAIYGAVMGLIFYSVSGCSGGAETESKNVRLIKETDFEAEVTRASMPVVVDFYAPWCGPCRRLSPMLDKMAGPFTNKVKFVKVNVDEAPALSKQFKIEAIPLLLFFKNGKVIDSIVGLPSSDELNSRLQMLAQVTNITQ
jgi:thioredoxin 1